MAIELPADLEPHGDYDQFHDAGVYAIELARPDDLHAAWKREFDHVPKWFVNFRDADSVYYVGATADVLARLEDHRDAEVRKAVLLRVCDPVGIERVEWHDAVDEAFEAERSMADDLTDEYPKAYVHQR